MLLLLFFELIWVLIQIVEIGLTVMKLLLKIKKKVQFDVVVLTIIDWLFGSVQEFVNNENKQLPNKLHITFASFKPVENSLNKIFKFSSVTSITISLKWTKAILQFLQKPHVRFPNNNKYKYGEKNIYCS